jgi:hypothetical protein
MKKLAQTLIISSFVVSPCAMAATQGTAGATSTGTAQIGVTKGDGTRVTALNDIHFGASNTAPTAKQIDDICVYSTTGGYSITATSQGNGSGGGQFRMVDAATNEFIRYFVEFRTDTASQNGTALAHNVTQGTAAAPLGNADTISNDCTAGANLNARLIYSVDATTFNAASPSTYTDTLTVVVAPL